MASAPGPHKETDLDVKARRGTIIRFIALLFGRNGLVRYRSDLFEPWWKNWEKFLTLKCQFSRPAWLSSHASIKLRPILQFPQLSWFHLTISLPDFPVGYFLVSCCTHLPRTRPWSCFRKHAKFLFHAQCDESLMWSLEEKKTLSMWIINSAIKPKGGTGQLKDHKVQNRIRNKKIDIQELKKE